MPIIKKPDYTIFASEAKNGELSAFPDLLRGWGVTIDQTAGKPPMEWFNTLQKRTDEWLTYLSQRGISEWDNMLDYPKNAVVQSGGNFYVSITENKSKSPDKSQSDWKPMADALNIKIQDATLTSKGIVQLSNATNSTSEVMAATPKSVKAAYDLASEKYSAQDATTTQKGIVQLSSATDSASETMAATPKAVKAAYDLAKSIGVNTLYPVGIVVWFAQNKNPNTLFPGTTWKYIGENKTIRLGKADGTDIMTTGGADSVTLAVGNLPAHGHAFSANTSTFDYGNKATTGFDYGTKQTDAQGNHTHTFDGRNAEGRETQVAFIGSIGGAQVQKETTAAGNHAHNIHIGAHNHTVGIGAHSHSVSGTTANAGSGTAVSVTNPYIKLMGWYRSA